MIARLLICLPACLLIAQASAAPKKTTIVVLGDSITEGYGIEKSSAYPALVEERLKKDGLNVEIVNAGISGSTSASGAGRLKWFLKKKPEVLLLALGANDGLRGVKISATKKNILDIIKMAKKNNIRVFLAGMKMPPNYGKSYTIEFSKLYKDIARDEKIPLLLFLLEGVAGDIKLNQTDGIHPNEKGHQIIAQHVADFIKEHL
ncbi:MAG: arylesterase [Bdellovibrionales bacterium]|nr:arylesterase [Bdellovibrionales bacterium]